MTDNHKPKKSDLTALFDRLIFVVEQTAPIAFAEDVDPKNSKILHRFIDEMSAVYMALSMGDLNMAFGFCVKAQTYFESLQSGSIKRHADIAKMGLPSMPAELFKVLRRDLVPFVK